MEKRPKVNAVQHFSKIARYRGREEDVRLLERARELITNSTPFPIDFTDVDLIRAILRKFIADADKKV